MASLYWTNEGTAWLYHGDARDMAELSSESVGLIVTSPPYWDLKNYGHNGQMGLGQSYQEYLRELGKVLTECERVLQPGRHLCLVIGTRISDGDLKHIPADVIGLQADLGMTLKKEIIWVKPKGTQGLWQRGTTQFLRDKPHPLCFNLNIQHEYVLIFQKAGLPPDFSDVVLAEDFIKQVAWSVWVLPVSQQKGHPAPFPEELVSRLLKLYSVPGEMVLDPFIGSGTTAKVCLELGRKAIGYEISEEFCEMSVRRLHEPTVALPGL
jgi:DNA modification methylase